MQFQHNDRSRHLRENLAAYLRLWGLGFAVTLAVLLHGIAGWVWITFMVAFVVIGVLRGRP